MKRLIWITAAMVCATVMAYAATGTVTTTVMTPRFLAYSTATQLKLNTKLNTNGSGASLTGITATQVGLGNVNNTSDANKPVSTAQQTKFDNLSTQLLGKRSSTDATFSSEITAPSFASSAADGTHYISVGNGTRYTGTQAHGYIFANATTMYYNEAGVSKRMGSGTGGTTDISGKLDTSIFNTYTSNRRATVSYVDTAISGVTAGSLPQSASDTGKADGASWINTTTNELVTRIAGKIYSVAMSLKATLIAALSWATSPPDFGSVALGSFANYSTTLNNTGTYATASLGFSNVSTARFKIYSAGTVPVTNSSTTSASIPAGGNIKIKYRFSPDTAGAHSNVIHATSTGIADAVLALSGIGVVSCNSGTLTGGIDWITGKTNGSGGSLTAASPIGQSFQLASTVGVYSFTIVISSEAGANQITCRYGTTANLSTTYIGSGTATMATGAREIVFDTHTPITSGTTIYAACVTAGDTPTAYYQRVTDAYSGGVNVRGTGNWSLSDSGTGADLKFQVKVCQ